MSESQKKYYFTTPIYYVNAAPHIGHAYTTIAADVIKRWKQLQGYDVKLTTGTDEHGQKIARAAAAQNKQPKEFTDLIAAEFKDTWDSLKLNYDYFQRTTDPKHAEQVGKLYHACKENGFVYSGTYSGTYCFSDELYVNDAKDGDPCPDCGRPLEFITEENHYFKLSAFTNWLIEYHEKNPDFCQPEIRRNEVLSFLKQEGGLKDLSISRSTVKWGIPVPDAPGQVFYVWFDALMAYYTAAQAEDRWPADLHLIGKEILRFHAIYWPAFLKAAGWELPKKIFAHGWLLFDNDKMSKSKGNIVRATPIQKVLGADALRYFLLREVPFGSDGNFSFDALVTRYNADLANGLGNLAARTLKLASNLEFKREVEEWGGSTFDISLMTEFEELPNVSTRLEEELPTQRWINEVKKNNEKSFVEIVNSYENFQFHKALSAIWEVVTHLDQYLVQQSPWKQPVEDAKKAIGYTLAGLKLICDLAEPVLPESIAKIREQMNGGELAPVFPRADAKEVIPKMHELEQEELTRQKTLLAPAGAVAEAAKAEEPKAEEPAYISIDDFAKVDLRVGLILSAEAVPKADKLLHLKIDLAEPSGPRTILAGIAQYYQPEQLINRKVVVVANLAPRKMRGIESQGMVVAASLEGGSPVLAGFLEEVPVGARLK